jgi:pilus assembly protein Flp/PilA
VVMGPPFGLLATRIANSPFSRFRVPPGADSCSVPQCLLVLAPFHPFEISMVPFEFGSGPLLDGLRDGIQSIFRFSGHGRRMKTIRRFLADESGATAIEYGLIAAGIALAIIAVVNGIGAKLNTKFSSINSSLK